MCDYSLHHVATRPAKVGDELTTTRFANSITRGFSAVGDPHVAVCLLPGTEIAFDENVECEPSFGIGILPNKKIGQRLARFRQVNMDNAVTHHDALEFPDGQVVLLTRLCEGQRASVLQLPAGRALGGSCSTVACWPSHSRVSNTTCPSGNSSASWCITALSMLIWRKRASFWPIFLFGRMPMPNEGSHSTFCSKASSVPGNRHTAT
jgi:hypothetical protein